jgi:hypothetical protein
MVLTVTKKELLDHFSPHTKHIRRLVAFEGCEGCSNLFFSEGDV